MKFRERAHAQTHERDSFQFCKGSGKQQTTKVEIPSGVRMCVCVCARMYVCVCARVCVCVCVCSTGSTKIIEFLWIREKVKFLTRGAFTASSSKMK